MRFAAVKTILDTIADKEFKELAVMANKLQPKEQQPRVVKEAIDVADLEVITEALKSKFPQQNLPSKEICAQIGEVFAHLHNAHKEFAAAAEGLAQLATSVSPDQYTMILNAAALLQIQLVVPGMMLSPMTAPPPPDLQPSTAQGSESIISYTKSQVLPNPHSSKKRPCDTTDHNASKVSLKKKKTEKRTSRVEPSTSTVITPHVEPSTSTAVPT